MAAAVCVFIAWYVGGTDGTVDPAPSVLLSFVGKHSSLLRL